MMRSLWCDTGQSNQYLQLLHLLLIFSFFSKTFGIILSGAPDAYARYPKWAHSFENSLSLEFKTKQSNGLMLYTDDGGVNGNFYSLTISDGRIQLDFRLGDNTNDYGPKRSVNTIRIEEVRVDDDRWHTLSLFQSWENVKLELDYTLVFKILNQRSFVFGNILRNSDVFIGGIPPDIHQLPTMSSPLHRYTRHLAANIRNLVYRLYPQGVTSPQILSIFGARNNEDDHCRHTGFSSREQFSCLNEGRCYSTNDGPKCDCSTSDHEGKTCEHEKPDAELLFSGQEWLGYDVSSNVSGSIRYKSENLTITFKTVHGSALLFFAGDDKSYLHLMLEDGALIASSKFDGTDARLIRMFNTYPGERYDDDSWHIIVLERTLQKLTMTVDGRKDEIRQYAPDLDWIVNSFAYLGGLPNDLYIKGINRIAYRGCMKKIKYEADAHQIMFVTLADQGFGENIMRTGGDLSYSCRNPAQPPDVLSFITGKGYVSLPKWGTNPNGGSLSFHFRTSEPDGLILFHGERSNNSSDYIAFELIDGHLYMIINLGSGAVRLQTTAHKVSDGTAWHSVHMERMGRTGRVVVDSMKTDFSTPGVSANLIIDEPVHVGFVPSSTIPYPSTIWTITLGKGFIGCFKNLRLNGISAKIASVYEQSNSTGINLGCAHSISVDHCDAQPCFNFGRCENTMTSFRCDCSATNMDGPTCNIDPTVVTIENDIPIQHIFPYTIHSEAESVNIRFKTDHPRGVLLETKSLLKSKHRIVIQLIDACLNITLSTEDFHQKLTWGKGLADNRWHWIQMKRRGEKILLFLDGKWEKSYFLTHPVIIEMDEIIVGKSASHMDDERKQNSYKGTVTKMMFNDLDLLDKVRKDTKSSKETKGQRNIKSKHSSVSFVNTTGYLVYSSSKISSFTGAFRVSFKFQTLVRSAILFATFPLDSPGSIILELINGRLRYTYKAGHREKSIMSPKLAYNQHLSDMRWHTILVYQDPKTGDHTMFVDNTTTTLQDVREEKAMLIGTATLGGFPPSFPSGLAASSRGFRGCISSLRLNDHTLDIIEEAESKKSVVKGCQGPIARCSPAACSNDGRCIQQWNSIRCDCTLTGRGGERCHEPATTVEFSGLPSALYYEYPDGEQPSSSQDYLVMAFRTKQKTGVLYSVECVADQDFLTIYLKDGHINMIYNLGNRDHRFGYSALRVDDDELHTIRMYRQDANITFQVDKRPALRYSPKDSSLLVTLNMQWRLVLGATFNIKHLDETNRNRVERRTPHLFDPYQGQISGVNFNGILILDLFAQGSPRIHTIGLIEKINVATPIEKEGEDIMAGQITENPTEALIESIGTSCLSLEQQESCFIETESTGFFTPVLPSAVTTPRRATTPPKGELQYPTSSHLSPVTRRVHTSTTRITTSTNSPWTNQVVYLSESESEGSGDFFQPALQQLTTATKPLVTTTPKPPSTPTTKKIETTTTIKEVAESIATVLPRPYESVHQAAEQNPEYLGESIWSDVDLLPEPMITGPAWRTHLTNTTTPRTTTTSKPTKLTTQTTRTNPTRPTTTYKTTTERTSTFTFSTLITTTTTKLSKAKITPHFTVNPVRPTTPMGDLATTTMKTVESADFPRTALISIASVSVIMVIAVVVFCVFRCRQNPPPGDHYPMACNGKTQSGYTPIAPELSPPLGIDSSTQPLLGRVAPQQINGNGYQPLKGSVIPNGNGVNGVNGRNGGGPVKPGVTKKKDFKEWYV